MRFGAHVSIAKSLADSIDRAVSSGCDAMQIFPGNPRGWQPSFLSQDEAEDFRERRSKNDIRPVAIHLPYLVNLGSPIDRVFEASISSIKNTLAKARLIDADFLVTHTGSHTGAGYQIGFDRIIAALNEILEEDFGSTKLLLENTAGAGHTIGSRLEEFEKIFKKVSFDKRLGLCVDTCHAYAAGYDIADKETLDHFLAELGSLIGGERLLLMHANDCKSQLGSHLDRHEQIGEGSIGLDGFRNILAHPTLQDMTFIIETPRPVPGDDVKNLQTLKKLAPSRA